MTPLIESENTEFIASASHKCLKDVANTMNTHVEWYCTILHLDFSDPEQLRECFQTALQINELSESASSNFNIEIRKECRESLTKTALKSNIATQVRFFDLTKIIATRLIFAINKICE